MLGAGPHGREIAALLHAELFDDHLPGFRPVSANRYPFVVGAAWPRVRRQIADCAPSFPCGCWPHGEGAFLFPGAVVSKAATLGPQSHVGYNAVVSHGCQVGAFVNICAGVVLGGEVTVEDDVFIGANATVIHGGITIGRGAVIGAGAVVIEDVPAGVTVAGVPARAVRSKVGA